eukprot:1150712-Pelagomonas_calceolata.AAC.2
MIEVGGPQITLLASDHPKMAYTAPSSSSHLSARWLKPVKSTQHLLADCARQGNAKAARKGKPAAQKNPVGRPPGDSSVAAALASNCTTVVACVALGLHVDDEVCSPQGAKVPLQPPAPEQQQQQQQAAASLAANELSD